MVPEIRVVWICGENVHDFQTRVSLLLSVVLGVEEDDELESPAQPVPSSPESRRGSKYVSLFIMLDSNSESVCHIDCVAGKQSEVYEKSQLV